jgi:hypothetical protein
MIQVKNLTNECHDLAARENTIEVELGEPGVATPCEGRMLPIRPKLSKTHLTKPFHPEIKAALSCKANSLPSAAQRRMLGRSTISEDRLLPA